MFAIRRPLLGPCAALAIAALGALAFGSDDAPVRADARGAQVAEREPARGPRHAPTADAVAPAGRDAHALPRDRRRACATRLAL